MKQKFDNVPISYLLYQAERAMHQNINQSLLAAGIPLIIEQWVVLRELFNENGVTQQELANKTRKDKTTLTRLIDTLEKNGWVERAKDPEDRRKRLVFYTLKAENQKKDIIEILRKNNKKALKNIEGSRIKEMRETLLCIFQNLAWEFDFMNTNCRLKINKEK